MGWQSRVVPLRAVRLRRRVHGWNIKKLVSVSPDGQQLLASYLRQAEAEAASMRQAELARMQAEAERHRHEAAIARDDVEFQKALTKIENAKGPAGRRGGLEAGLAKLTQQHMRERLLLEASRIEVQAALEKAESLKSPAAKVRTLREALTAIRNDPVPDELQAQQIRWLEEAIAAIEGEKNSIDEV